jgi:hypothetical protein
MSHRASQGHVLALSPLRFTLAGTFAAGLLAAATTLAGCSGGDNNTSGTGAQDAAITGDATNASDATGGGDAGTADGAAPGPDATTDGSSVAEAGADSAARTDAGCSCPLGGGLPTDLTMGQWVFFNSTDSANLSWDGTALVFTSFTPACCGATLAAYADWKSTNGAYAAHEIYTGTYTSATRQISLQGTSLQNPQGSVVLDDPTATYDPVSDQLVNGSWSQGHPGTFTARHVIGDASAPADAASE